MSGQICGGYIVGGKLGSGPLALTSLAASMGKLAFLTDSHKEEAVER